MGDSKTERIISGKPDTEDVTLDTSLRPRLFSQLSTSSGRAQTTPPTLTMGKPSRSLRLAVATEQSRNFAIRAHPIITLGRRVLPLVT